jgi:glyoxylate reductase
MVCFFPSNKTIPKKGTNVVLSPMVSTHGTKASHQSFIFVCVFGGRGLNLMARLLSSSSRPLVLVTRPVLGLDKLHFHERKGNLIMLTIDNGKPGLTSKELLQLCDQHKPSGVVSMLSDQLNTSFFQSVSPTVKCVAQYAVGTNNIDLVAARQKGIHVSNTPDVLTDATADQAFALLLGIVRNVVNGDKYVREGKFQRFETQLMLGIDLRGATLGVIGMGRIGRAFAQRARAFGMNIAYHNRKRVSQEIEAELGGAKFEPDLAALIRTSDVISIHCPLTPETKHLIGAEELRTMKKSAFLINTARGPVINEAELAQALSEGIIAGAGIDVFEFEPKVNEKLLKCSNVVLAPHLGSATVGTRTKMGEMCSEAILAALGIVKADHIPNLCN